MSKKMWDYLFGEIRNEYGTSGLMANLDKESGLRSNNAQNSGNNRLGMTDAEYTAAVDNGTYTAADFAGDKIGYGLAQWTTKARKSALYNYIKAKGKSIGDEVSQLEFLIVELKTDFKTVWDALCNASSVREASDIVLTRYEMPKDKDDEEKKARRASVAQKYYDKYAKGELEESGEGTVAEDAYVTYKVVRGDNLTRIAKKFGTTVAAIVEANGIPDPDDIDAGDELKIPKAEKPEPEPILHKVERGDNLTKIAGRYSTTIAAIVAANRAKYRSISRNYIVVGWNLIIPSGGGT